MTAAEKVREQERISAAIQFLNKYRLTFVRSHKNLTVLGNLLFFGGDPTVTIIEWHFPEHGQDDEAIRLAKLYFHCFYLPAEILLMRVQYRARNLNRKTDPRVVALRSISRNIMEEESGLAGVALHRSPCVDISVGFINFIFSTFLLPFSLSLSLFILSNLFC